MMIKYFLVIFLVAPCLRADTYFKSVSGTVYAGNFTYYSLITEGPIQVILRTKKGDADIYISQRSVTPTFDTQGYCLHSATCGIDIVDIPSSFGRPVGIGVYGHPSHEESEYVLDLRVKSGPDGEFENLFDEYEVPFETSASEVDGKKYEEEEEVNDRPFLLSFLLAFIDIFLEVILL